MNHRCRRSHSLNLKESPRCKIPNPGRSPVGLRPSKRDNRTRPRSSGIATSNGSFNLPVVGLALAAHRTVEDAEDAAISAFQALYAGAIEGRFDQLNDRIDLWRLLTAITINKVLNQKQRHHRQKRGGPTGEKNAGPDGSEPILGNPVHVISSNQELAEVLSKEPTPESAALIDEAYHALLRALEDPRLEQIAVCKMEGRSNPEIAQMLGCAVRTVERKLERIRAIWIECGLGL